MHRKFRRALAKGVMLLLSAHLLATPSWAAQGDMGTGIPQFGLHSIATGQYAIVWGLQNATIPFPVGCTSIRLTPATMSMDSFKLAVGVMLTAQATNRKVKFYAHADRDGGCGVDYVELVLG